MRFPSKHSFVRASLLFIFALPTPAFADAPEGVITDALVAPTAARSEPRLLNLAEAQKAFGPEFSTKDVNGTVILFGGTSKECMESFDVSNNSKSGEFKILYKGDNDSCLSHADAIKDISRGGYVGLDSLPDGTMKAEGTFSSVGLVWENYTSTKRPFESLEIPVDAGAASISHLSAVDAAATLKKAETEKKEAQSELDLLLVSKCHRGLKELDVGEEALERLMQVPELVKDKGDDWLADTAKKFREEKFQACRKQILKARTDEIASASCEDRLSKIMAEDESYTGKVKSLYLDLVNRYMNSQTMSMDEAFTAAMDTVEKIRGFDLSEKEEAELAATEQNVHLHFLNLAAQQGTDSEAFKLMRANMLDFMAATDDVASCLTDNGAISPMQRMNPACARSQWLSLQLGQQTVIANGTQAMLNKKAQEQADTQTCVTLRAGTSTNGMALNPADEAKCKAIELAADAKIKATVNAGISTSGFGEVVTTPTTPAPDSAPGSTDSGLMNSVYTAPSNTATTTQTPAPAPVNTVASGQRRIFH